MSVCKAWHQFFCARVKIFHLVMHDPDDDDDENWGQDAEAILGLLAAARRRPSLVKLYVRLHSPCQVTVLALLMKELPQVQHLAISSACHSWNLPAVRDLRTRTVCSACMRG